MGEDFIRVVADQVGVGYGSLRDGLLIDTISGLLFTHVLFVGGGEGGGVKLKASPVLLSLLYFGGKSLQFYEIILGSQKYKVICEVNVMR